MQLSFLRHARLTRLPEYALFLNVDGKPARATRLGGFGLLALACSATCLFLLTRRRSDDINMESVWLCSHNDIVANVGVLFAGAGVALTGSM